MMSLKWFDFVGFAGVLLVLLAYLALQMQKLRGDGMAYSVLNLFGAACILIPVVYAEQMNWSVLIIEAAWIAISLYGMWQVVRRQVGVGAASAAIAPGKDRG